MLDRALWSHDRYSVRTNWKAIVMINVCIGFTLGMMANTVSPTNPRDVEATPDVFISKLAMLNRC